MALDVNASDFQREVVDRSHETAVIVDFWAPWCGPCRTLGPILERLEAQAAGRWILVKVNTDDNQSLGQSFSIQGIPAVKAFVGGKVVDEFVGALPESKVREWLAGFVVSEASTLSRKGSAAVAAGDAEGATTFFADALTRDESEPDALVFMARAALSRGDKTGARALLQRLPPSARSSRLAEISALEFGIAAPPLAQAEAAYAATPNESAARHDLALALAAEQRWEAALEHLFGLVQSDRAYGDDAGRKWMLRVFDAVGIRSDVTTVWRSKLSMELYK